MSVKYSSQSVLNIREDLIEPGFGMNLSAAEMLKDYAALLAVNEVACDNCKGSGKIQVAHGEGTDSYWNCPHCMGGVVHGDPLQEFATLLARWETDAKEYLFTWGQHMPCSVENMAEMLEAAIKRTRLGHLRGKYKGKFSTVEEFLEDRRNDDVE